jgi:hypothetical protein
MLARLTLEALLDSFRYRRILGAAGADALRKFDLGSKKGVMDRGHIAMILGPGPLEQPSRETVHEIIERLGDGDRRRGGRIFMKSSLLVSPITRGEHARVQMALLREAITTLRRADITVIVVETPLSPLASALYDAGTRQDFLAFMTSVQHDHDIRFVPLDPARPYLESEFGDLVHLTPAGARRLTRTVNRALRIARSESADEGKANVAH